MSGFRVNWMNLRDADTGKILWQVSNKLYFYLFINFDSLSIHPFNYSSMHLSICLSIYLFIDQFTSLSILSIYKVFRYLTIYSSIPYLIIFSFTHLFIYPSIYLSIYLSISSVSQCECQTSLGACLSSIKIPNFLHLSLPFLSPPPLFSFTSQLTSLESTFYPKVSQLFESN